MIDEFLLWLCSAVTHRPLAATTIREYERQLHAFACWLHEDLGVPWRVEEISAHRMAAYIQHLQGTLQRALATQQKAVTTLKMYGSWLVTTGQLRINPALQLHAQAEQAQPPKALSALVVRRVLDAAYHTGHLRDAVVLELLATSGMGPVKLPAFGSNTWSGANGRCGCALLAKEGNSAGYPCRSMLAS